MRNEDVRYTFQAITPPVESEMYGDAGVLGPQQTYPHVSVATRDRLDYSTLMIREYDAGPETGCAQRYLPPEKTGCTNRP